MYIQILTSAIFIATSLYGSATTEITDGEIKDIKTKTNFATEITIKNPVSGPFTLENYVKNYFADTPILAEIARCESEYKHTGESGKIIRGIVNPDDVGIMQINEYYHTKSSKALGYDLHSLDGNLAYAKWLYDEFGTSPWNASKKCWSVGGELAKS